MQAVSRPQPIKSVATSIHQPVQEALRMCGYRQLAEVEAHEMSGGVQIEGVVPTYFLKQMAQTVAMSVSGVERVNNVISVE